MIVHYEIEDLNIEQAVVAIMAIDAIIKFLNNDPDHKPSRATVIGAGDSRVFCLINTLVLIIR